ncbi:hypothetical protein KDD30_15240 [Photobacterium sp. GJ3]|uniref:hypothetical protein n=1 Tax=Photobacterium sp. GJ3 TaxID=2829502 RepID=UPI001B8C0B6C|nr:hypothetical protein [Photobacterium sp. GJ3]QUJ67371.1 hypothetical protein KDD30_15240 [Photobacterium sp. GJ3]
MKYFIFLLFFLSPTTWAACYPNQCQGVGKDILVSVYPSSTGNIYLEAPAGKEKLNCKLAEGYYMTLKNTHPIFEVMYSTILTAVSTQKKLTVRIVENSEGCEVMYVRMFT